MSVDSRDERESKIFGMESHDMGDLPTAVPQLNPEFHLMPQIKPMKKNIIDLMQMVGLFLIVITSSIGCQKEIQDKVMSPNNLKLGDLVVGQKSYYERFAYNYYDRPVPGRTFTKDTLVVEVLRTHKNGMLVREYLTASSQIRYGSIARYQDTVELIWSVSNDSLHVKNVNGGSKRATSFLLHTFFRPIDIGLYPEGELELQDWLPSEQGAGAEVSSHFAPYNIHLDYSVMIVDGPGKFYIFKPLGQIVRTASHTPWGGTGEGWELLAN